MSVRVRDLEIALVLAREMKAAAARSVDASLRLDQLQEVFGVEELDHGERARIQTALQMAGLEPFPSLLEADPTEPIRFGAVKAAAGATQSPGDEPPPEAPPAADAPPTFPTVGQFARSKFGRSRRARRGDHANGHAPPPVEPELEFEPEPEDEPQSEPDFDATQVHEVVEEDVADATEEAAPDPFDEAPPEVGEEDAPEEIAQEPEFDRSPVVDAAPELEPETESEPDEREYIPLVPHDERIEEPVAPPQPEPVATAAPSRKDELLAPLLPAVVIPVVVTSIAGWRFGLPFAALSVIAIGVLLGRGPGRRGLIATLRESSLAGTILITTAVVSILSVAAAVLLTSVGKDSGSTAQKTAQPAKKAVQPSATQPTPATAKPAAKPKPPKPKRHPAPQDQTPPPDPSTQGLVRVPPASSATPSTGTPGTGTATPQPGTGTTQPGTGQTP
jgi:hypothetical protein